MEDNKGKKEDQEEEENFHGGTNLNMTKSF